MKFSSFCTTCNSIVEHERVFEYKYNIDRKDDVSISGTLVTLGKCLNCSEPILQRDKFNHIDDHYWSPMVEVCNLDPICLLIQHTPKLLTQFYKSDRIN